MHKHTAGPTVCTRHTDCHGADARGARDNRALARRSVRPTGHRPSRLIGHMTRQSAQGNRNFPKVSRGALQGLYVTAARRSGMLRL